MVSVSEPVVDYNELTEKRVKFGRYHYIAYVLINFITFSDGSEMVCLSLLLPILRDEWGLSTGQQEILGTILFLGMMLGSMVSGYLSDNYGRRLTLTFASLIQFLMGVGSMLAPEFYTLLAFRSLFGFTIGITIPIASVLVTEITPVRIRGIGIVLLSLGLTIGSVYGCMIALLTLDSLTSGNWRLMLFLGAVPGLLGFFGLFFFVYESPRFEISRGNVEKAVDTLNKIGSMNDKDYQKIVLSDVAEGLANWSQNTYDQAQRANIRMVFSRKNIRMTICLMVLKFCLDFAQYGIAFISPYILNTTSSKDSGVGKITITYLVEVPSLFLALAAIENKHFGRKNSLAISAVMILVFMVLSIVAFDSLLVFALSAGKFFLKIGQTMFWPAISESYPTTYRSLAAGVISGFGRVGSVLVPVICLWLYHLRDDGPLFGFSAIACLAVVSSVLIPFDMTGRQLDSAPEPETLKIGDSETSQLNDTLLK